MTTYRKRIIEFKNMAILAQDTAQESKLPEQSFEGVLYTWDGTQVVNSIIRTIDQHVITLNLSRD